MRTENSDFKRRIMNLCVLGFLLLAGGCSGHKAAPSADVPKLSNSAAAASASHTASPQVPRSTFASDDSARDPFNPKAKRAAINNPAEAAPQENINLPALLQAEFQGVMGSGEHRIAMINNVMLEPGRDAVITIRAADGERRLNVHCREVTRTSVVLEVQGHGQPLVISRVTKLVKQ